MLEKEFEMWPRDPILDAIFVTFGMHINNFDNLEHGLVHFTKFSNGGTKKSN